jgi:hypothetical protein
MIYCLHLVRWPVELDVGRSRPLYSAEPSCWLNDNDEIDFVACFVLVNEVSKACCDEASVDFNETESNVLFCNERAPTGKV